MDDRKLKKARDLIRTKPYLSWYVGNYKSLSSESILESVLNYGDWNDFMQLKQILGIEQTYKLFEKIKNKKRSNLRPQTVNFFTKYFGQHA